MGHVYMGRVRQDRLARPATTFLKAYATTGMRIRAACMGLILAGSGCSVDGAGLVEVNQTQTETSLVQQTSAGGLHLSTRGPHAGLTLGAVNSVIVQAVVCGIGHLRLAYSRSVGLHLTLSHTEFGINIGYRERLLALPGPTGTATSLHFDPERPMRTAITFEETVNCNQSGAT